MIEILVTFHPYTRNTVKWHCEVSSDKTFITLDDFLVYTRLPYITMDTQADGKILFKNRSEATLPCAKKTAKRFVNKLYEFVKECEEAHKEAYVLSIGD
jgi:uncharacterized protein YaaR (DUF327 family)